MTNALESMIELFNELADHNEQASIDLRESEPMFNYYEGKRDAYRLAAERIQMALALEEASTFEEDA